MKYAGMIKNDIAGGAGVCVSFFTQGCPFHCKNCHNPETWDFNGGRDFTVGVLQEIDSALTDNGVDRNLNIMGGEPLCKENYSVTKQAIEYVRNNHPGIIIYVWTGNTLESLKRKSIISKDLKYILNNIDYIIDGLYVDELRDITLQWRGSSNQRVFQNIEGKFKQIL